MLVLPIAFIPLIANFPTGLVLYWMTTNLWTVGQGLVTRRLAPKPKAPEKRSSRTPAKAAARDEPAAAAKPAPAQPRVVRRKKKRTRR
jgi:YidC/Oxa1 family membrane protein insertase